MAKNIKSEKWAVVKFNFNYSNNMRMEVSNHGRVRTFTKIADGKILKGSLLGGYRMMAQKLFEPTTPQAKKRFVYLKSEISKLTKQLAPLKNNLATHTKKNNAFRIYKKQIAQGTAMITQLKKKYRTEFDADVKKRTIYLSLLVHRLVAEKFCSGKSVKRSQVIHLDHNKLNNHFTNLKWATQEEITQHQKTNPVVKASIKKRVGKRYENSKNFKLTSTKVMRIKKKLNNGVPVSKLAKQFSVSDMQIHRIKRGENWADVKATF